MPRNYELAQRQVRERIAEIDTALEGVAQAMAEHRPADAVKHLSDAKAAIEGATTTAQWACTLDGDD
jgi:hypothetical protein